jgi:DNA gyrase subunit A
MGRATQGVRLIRLDEDDEIASVAKVEIEDEQDPQIEGQLPASPEEPSAPVE